MNTKTWSFFLLFVAGGSVVSGAEPAEVIWWAAKERSRSANVKKPGVVAPNTSRERPDRPSHAGSGHHPSGMSEGTSGGAADTDETSRDTHPRGMPEAMMRRTRDQGKRPEGMPEGMRGKRGGGGGRSGGMPSREKSADGMSGERRMPSRAEMLAVMRKPKPLLLRWGDFPSRGDKNSAVGKLLTVDKVEAWIRTPDGTVARADLNLEGDTVATKCPPKTEDGAECPNGICVVGMHLDAGVMDFDADGEMERVHFYSNGLVSHFRRDGVRGDKPDVLFKDSEKVALEIGPITSETQRGAFRATSQMAMEENKLQVFYKGRPLANAEVSVLSDSGWRNKVTTDAEGVLTIVPVGKKSDGRMRMTPSDKCLYVVLHKESVPGEHGGVAYAAEYHCASLLMGVRMPRPEWESKAEGFSLVTVSSMGFLVLVGVFAIYRRKKRNREIMVQFDQYRISRES